jgi:DNA-binding GntR family transcriptional regulator
VSTSDVPLGLAHAPLRDQIREEIRQRIVEGRLAPGDRMIERELAAELGVSRVPVREALRILETEAFVQDLPRRGGIVRRLSRHDVEELFDVRESLEVLATRRAATNATSKDLARLEDLLTEAESAIESGDRQSIGAANERFHDTVLGLSNNSLLSAMLEPLRGRLHWLFRQNEDPSGLLSEHRELFDAIASGNPDRAGEAALAHVVRNRELAIRMLFEKAPARTPDLGRLGGSAAG